MKLLQENHHGEFLLESTISNGKLMLEGPMVQCNAKNRNGRNYDLETVGKPAVDRYNKEFILEGRAIGELEHPEYPLPKLTEAAVFIAEPFKWHGNNAHGKMEVLTNAKGQIIRSLSEAGYRLGTSTRGLGEVDKRTGQVKPGYFITASDVVDKPSGQVCYMTAIQESVEWEVENGVWVPKNEIGHKVDQFINEHSNGESIIVKKFKDILNHL